MGRNMIKEEASILKKELYRFWKADVIDDCKEAVAKENAAMLYLLTGSAFVANCILLIYSIITREGKSYLVTNYAIFAYVYLCIFLLVKKAVSENLSWIPKVIIVEYVILVFHYTLTCVVWDWNNHIFSYYLIMLLAFVFLVKPLQMVVSQLITSGFLLGAVFAFKPKVVIRDDFLSILFVTVVGIALGSAILYFRMDSIYKIDVRTQALKIKNLYQGILDETQTAVCVCHAKTREIMYLNRKAEEIFAISGKDAIGKKCYQFLYGEIIPCENCQMEQSKCGETQNREIKIANRFYSTKGRIIDWNGQEAYIEYLTDITDSKKVEEQMWLAHEKLQEKYEEELLYREKAVSEDVLSTSRVNLTRGIVEEMRVGNVDGLEKEYRYNVDFSDRISSFLKKDWLSEEQKYQLSREGLLDLYETGVTSCSVEFVAELLQGGHAGIRAEVNLLKRPDNGDILAFVYNHNISKEKILGQILECMMSFEYDEVYTVDESNACYTAETLGKFALEGQGTSGLYQDEIENLVQRASTEEEKKLIRQEMSLETMHQNMLKEEIHTFEVMLLSKNGKMRQKQIRYMYLEYNMGIFLVTLVDIDDVVRKEKEKQEQLERALQMAEEANKAKSRFLANMSHEIRTPMNAIIGLNTIMKDHVEQPEQIIAYTEKLDSASKYLLALLNDILDSARIESGNIKLAHEPIDEKAFWDNVNLLAAAQSGPAGIQYQFECKKEADGICYGDATRLQQIVVNLINNAIKFTPAGGLVRVTVQNEEAGSGKNCLKIMVADNGIGISEQFLPNMFRVFTQEHVDNTTKYQGSGLGLSIARSFAKMMDGDITVESQEGKGTTFCVTVLLDIERKQQKSEIEVSEEYDFHGKKVLLVEDHPLNTLVAEQILKRKGMIVVHAENGENALEVFRESADWEYDVILMDIRMPVLDGISATKEIRSMKRKDAAVIPIIAMTANAYEEDRMATKQAGMNEHLAKPIDPQQLYHVLAEFMKKEKSDS